MKDIDVIEKYISAAKLHRKSSVNGDHKTANKQYKVLKNIYDKIKKEKLEKDILLDLLEVDDINVTGWAAAHLLGLDYEIERAKNILEEIVSLDKGIASFSAKMVLKTWKEKGSLKF